MSFSRRFTESKFKRYVFVIFRVRGTRIKKSEFAVKLLLSGSKDSCVIIKHKQEIFKNLSPRCFVFTPKRSHIWGENGGGRCYLEQLNLNTRKALSNNTMI